MWKPDRSSSVALFQQIADEIERRIACGEFPPGSALPSERKLAEQAGVNRSTVMQAYAELRSAGIIESATGSGTRVSNFRLGPRENAPNWRNYLESGTFMPNLPTMRRIRSELRKDAPLIDFASGELSPDLFPRQAVQQLLRDTPFTPELGYDDPQGYSPLRQALVGLLKDKLNVNVTESSILITSGSQQSLYLIAQCLLSPGDAIAVEDPSYCYSLPMFRSAGLRVFRLPVDPERGVDPDNIEALHREHRLRMIFVNPGFQNPTGTVLQAERQLRLLQVAAQWGIPIVEDDPFSLTAFDGTPPRPLKSLDTNGQVLYIGSLSKIAASGFRIGWLAAPGSVISRLADARQQMDFGLSVIPQWTAAEFVRSGYLHSHLERLQTALFHKMHRLASALREHLPGLVSFRLPDGGLNLWCKLDPGIDPDKLLEEAVKRGVIYVPGTVFGSERGWIRLSYARPAAEQIEPGVRLLAEAVRSL
ncbi:PLP-dependent aminotransferase family protein [Paenibacillus hodogayensis]|uniref:PLP-dependent aminotransferase family protein n=1 Tax=Paenibacillus hodogayensis TaxID=279208 RepID=A0ABV5VUK7_9BACL